MNEKEQKWLELKKEAKERIEELAEVFSKRIVDASTGNIEGADFVGLSYYGSGGRSRSQNGQRKADCDCE